MDSIFSILGEYTNSIIASVIIVIAAIILWTCISKFFKKKEAKTENASGRRVTYMHFLYNFLKYAVIVIAFLGIMLVNDVNVSGILAGIGIISALVGLALQDELKDAIMGFHFLTDDFFQVGDVIEYKGEQGKVLSYNLKYVRMESMKDGGTLSICNRNISEIKKCKGLIFFDLPLSYEDDYEKVHELMRNCCEELKQNKLVDNCTYLGTQSFEEDAVTYRTRIECNPYDVYAVRRAYVVIIQKHIQDSGLTIPYSTMSVILDK